jgi:hypothetical protein
MKFFKDLARFGFAAFAVGSVGVWGADPVPFVRTFDAPDGETYYSISVQIEAPAAKALARDHVVLVDTSASQVGEYRRQTADVLRGLLQSLPATDRVQVLAVDLQTAPLTDGFVAPASAVNSAIANFDARFPAGATNLLNGLTTARDLIAVDRSASIIYLGDGMSAAHLLSPTEIDTLVDSLRERRIPVNGIAIGSNKDVRLLGTFAQQTGGLVLIDDWRNDADVTPAQKGAELAAAAIATVVYPTEITTDLELLPDEPLPLRGDVATVFVGRGDVAGQTLTLSGDGQTHAWTLPAPQSSDGNTFLFGLHQQAAAFPQNGTGLAGDTVIAFAQNAFEDQITALEAAGIQALRDGELEEAQRIGFAIRSVDPGNVRAVGLINGAFEKSKDGDVVFFDDAIAPDPDAPAVDDAAPAGDDSIAPETDPAASANVADPAVDAGAATPGLENRVAPPAGQSLITGARALQGARAQKLQQQLDEVKQAANEILRVDPEQALGMLDSLRNQIKSATDISPEAREQMLRELTSFQQYVRNQAAQRLSEIHDLQIKQRTQEQQQRLIEYATLQDEKMDQLVERVRTLLVDFYEGDDNAAEEAEMVGRLIVNLRPGNPYGVSTVMVSEAAGQLRKAMRLRALRADRYLETLYQVELSHVPFPDEPPVRYPPAEVWQALTERRKKWASVDLKQNNPNEQRIYEALDKKVDMEFIDTELGQAITFISDRYQIPIIPDETRLTEFGVGLDQPINLVISGITLRSALKLMLEQHDLTYIIEDEVMKVTTSEYANGLLQTRVYPVADLVIPIQPILGGFGGQGVNGGFSGQQNGQGLGGQQGGGGGGGFNVNVGGGGGQGNLFSVPAEETPRFDNDFIQGNRLKKKPLTLR